MQHAPDPSLFSARESPSSSDQTAFLKSKSEESVAHEWQDSPWFDVCVLVIAVVLALVSLTALLLDVSLIEIERGQSDGDSIGYVEAFNGSLRFRNSTTPIWDNAQKNQKLLSRDIIYTDEGATSQIKLEIGSEISLSEKTMVSLEMGESEPIIDIMGGSLDIKSSDRSVKVRLNGKFLILTGGSAAQIRRSSQGEAEINVSRGMLQINNNLVQQHQKIVLDSQGAIKELKRTRVADFLQQRDLNQTKSDEQKVKLETQKSESVKKDGNKGKAPSPMKAPKLPAKIHLEIPDQGSIWVPRSPYLVGMWLLTYTFEANSQEVSKNGLYNKERMKHYESVFSWEALEGAKSYIIQIYKDPNGSILLKSFASKINRVTISGLPPGRYYLRIAGVDSWGQTGEFSNFAQLTISTVRKNVVKSEKRFQTRKSTLNSAIKTQVTTIEQEKKSIKYQSHPPVTAELLKEINNVIIGMSYLPGFYEYHGIGLKIRAEFFNSWEFAGLYYFLENSPEKSLSQLAMGIKLRRMRTNFFEQSSQNSEQKTLTMQLLDGELYGLYGPRWLKFGPFQMESELGLESKGVEYFREEVAQIVTLAQKQKFFFNLSLGSKLKLANGFYFALWLTNGMGGEKQESNKLSYLLDFRKELNWLHKRGQPYVGIGSEQVWLRTIEGETAPGNLPQTSRRRSLKFSIGSAF